MSGGWLDTLIAYGLTGLYYAAALGWLLLLLVGLVRVWFRGWRRVGLVVLAVGTMWVGFHLFMEWTYAAKYHRVVEWFERIEKGMSEAEVRRILGGPSEAYNSGASSSGPDWWAYQREHWMCYPLADFPGWRVAPFF